MNNLVTVCVSVTACLCFVTAYDFQDATFNGFLIEDLEDGYSSLIDGPHNPRNRRDEEAAQNEKCKRRHRRPRLCCAEATFQEQLEKDKELFRICFKEVFGYEKPEKFEHRRDPFSCQEAEKRKNDMTCVLQCLVQKKDFIDEAGNPKEEGINTFLKEHLSKETWFDSIREKVVSACIVEAKNATLNQPKAPEGAKVCNPSGATLKHCLFREIQLNCPDDQIKDKRACEKFQERVKKGIDSPSTSSDDFADE